MKKSKLANKLNRRQMERIIAMGKETKPVNRHTRAGRDGRIIICPKCNSSATVYHFSWYALSCQHCHKIIEKYAWRTPLSPKDCYFINWGSNNEKKD